LLKSKTKLISVRVSEEELWAFRQICASQGFASLSDLTRTAIQEFIASRSANGQSPFEREVERLNAIVDKLDKGLKQLANPVTSTAR